MESLHANKNSNCEDTIISDFDGSSDEIEECVESNSHSDAVRKYDRSFLKYGFTYTGSEDRPLPECIVCGKILKNDSMVENELKKHFDAKHDDLIDTALHDYFESKLRERRWSVTERIQTASYKVAEIIVKNAQPYTVGETLILPACKEIVKSVLGEAAEEKVCRVSLSGNTISRCIEDMSADIQEQLIEKLCDQQFSLQLSEPIENVPLCHVRFFDADSYVEEFLSCADLRDIPFIDVCDFLKDMSSKNTLHWKECVSVCADRAINLQELVQNFRNIKIMIWNLNLASLMSITVSENFHNVLISVTKMIKCIRPQSKKFNVLQMIYEEAGIDKTLLPHTDIFKLCEGRLLYTFYEQVNELKSIFTGWKPEFVDLLTDPIWYSKLAYFAHISEYLNSLIESIHSNEENIFTFNGKLRGFVRMIKVWKIKIAKRDYSMFSFAVSSNSEVSNLILSHLSNLENTIPYFLLPIDEHKFCWIRNPFEITTEETNHLSLEIVDELTSLQTDHTSRFKFRKLTLIQFWNSVKQNFPRLAEDALYTLVHFSPTYLNEPGLSACLNVIRKKGERAAPIKDELRVCLSKIQPRIELLCKSNQKDDAAH